MPSHLTQVNSCHMFIDHQLIELAMQVDPHCSIKLMYPMSHNSIYLAKKANEALEPIKQGKDRHACCSLKLIPTKSPLVYYCNISHHIAPREALLSNSLESLATIFLFDLWKPECNTTEPDVHYLL
jgi:hypothetical protein